MAEPILPNLSTAAPVSIEGSAAEQLRQLIEANKTQAGQLEDLARNLGVAKPTVPARLDIFHQYIGVFLAAFLVAIIATPVMRRLAIANGIVDKPDEARKLHKFPIAYMGGVGVYLGIVAGILFSYLAPVHGLMTFHTTTHVDGEGAVMRVPLSILGGLTIIMLVGLLDDVLNISPWQKIGGQLLAAAFLAMEDVGTKVALQVLAPVGTLLHNPTLRWDIPLPFEVPLFGAHVPVDVVYWTGTAIIAVFVLGACNATNLIDGLDGLSSGVTAIASGGLLMVSLSLAAQDSGQLDSARVVLCLALLGACMGFLPHNFNPAVIFLGDCGSLLLGFATIVIVITLGEQGRTDLVLAGLIIYAIPIIDTTLAIIRRKLSRKRISDADDEHLHHMFKRALGVKGAVFSLYALGIGFAALGVWLAMSRARVTYALTMVFVLFIGVIAIKVARRKAFEQQVAEKYGTNGAGGAAAGGRPSASGGANGSAAPVGVQSPGV